MALQTAAHQLGSIQDDPQASPDAWARRQRQLYKHPWVVYAKAPLGGPAQVLEYLSRYTHPTAISNERIKAVTQREVVFSVRADSNGGKRTMRLDGPEFVHRFMRHLLPTGLKRIRHYGVLASACKGERLALARAALKMPAPNAQAPTSALGFLRRVARVDAQQCPCCSKDGHRRDGNRGLCCGDCAVRTEAPGCGARRAQCSAAQSGSSSGH